MSFSVLWSAARRGIPTMIHEQNAFAGMANRFLASWVDSVAVSFPESTDFFPAGKTWVSGLPVRMTLHTVDPHAARASFGLDRERVTFLAFGGSLGAHHLNEIFLDAWKGLVAQRLPFQVLHITGPRDFPTFETRFKENAISGGVLPYCHDMPSAYAAADLVLWVTDASGNLWEDVKSDSGFDSLGPGRPGLPNWIIRNKIDLVDSDSERVALPRTVNDQDSFNISAVTGAGVDQLLSALVEFVRGNFTAGEYVLITRERHRHALIAAAGALNRAVAGGLSTSEEVIAEELRLAANTLARLIGRVDVEDILDRIFRDFCIGK